VTLERLRKVWPGVLLVLVAVVGFAVSATLLISAGNTRQQEKIDTCRQINDHAVAPLRTLLALAQSASSRNPLPPGLSDDQRAYYENQRRQADDFYRKALDAAKPIDCRHLP
jgi:hypothetical protein